MIFRASTSSQPLDLTVVEAPSMARASSGQQQQEERSPDWKVGPEDATRFRAVASAGVSEVELVLRLFFLEFFLVNVQDSVDTKVGLQNQDIDLELGIINLLVCFK